MNRQLNRLAIFAVALLTVLVVATTYWQTWAAGGLEARQDNAIQVVAQFQIARGFILGNNGTTRFAVNKAKRIAGQTLYFRRYPEHGLAAQTIGYSTHRTRRRGSRNR
jgi:hypothetical protein